MLSLTKEMIGKVVKSKDQVLIMLSQFISFMFSLSLFAFCVLGTPSVNRMTKNIVIQDDFTF